MTTVSSLPPIKQRVVEADGTMNKTWYRFFKEHYANQEDMEAVEEGVQTVTTEIDQINGQWGITVNVDGRITGAIKLDGSITESVFAVLADKFIVVHPTADGIWTPVFASGLINGVGAVGINGDLMIDGSITAIALSVDTLDAISADLGEITAGLLQSADGNSYWNLGTGEFVIGAP